MNRKFKSKLEFTEYVLTLPDNEKTITLRVGKGKGFVGNYEYKNTAEPVRNSLTNECYGILERTEENAKKFLGDKYWPKPTDYSERTGKVEDGVKFVLKDNVTFDLSKERDLKNWWWIQYLPDIVLYKDDLNVSRNAHFYIDVPAYEASQNIEKYSITKEALNRLDSIKEGGFRELYDLLGFPGVDVLTEKEAQSFLLKEAIERNSSAQKIINMVDDPDYAVKTKVRLAIKHKIITIDNGSYKYGEYIIGQKEKHAVEFFKMKKSDKRHDILKSILNDIEKYSN